LVLVLVPVILGWALGTAAPVGVGASGEFLKRSAYLTDVTQTTAIVNFATNTASAAPIVAFGVSCPGGTLVTATAALPDARIAASNPGTGVWDYLWRARVTGLSAGSSYCYQISQNGTPLGGATSFTTAPGPATTSYSFAVIGDFGGGTTDEAMVMNQIRLHTPTFLVTVGDNAYPAGDQIADYGDLESGRVFGASYLPQVGGGVPMYVTQGNHGFTGYTPLLENFPQDDIVAASGGRYWAENYCCTAQSPANIPYASTWYAFNWGNARFYVLDGAWADGTPPPGQIFNYPADFQGHFNGNVPGCTPCGAETTWLQNDLAANAGMPLKFAFFHFPLYADNAGDPTDPFLNGPHSLEGLLAAHGVSVVFNGHAHQYERNNPLINGMGNVISGGGGGTPNPPSGSFIQTGGCATNPPPPAPPTVSSFDACLAKVNQFLLVTVSGTNVTVTPIDETGAAFDVSTYGQGNASHNAPDAPITVHATGGIGKATISWAPAVNDGGDPITSYTVRSNHGQAVTTNGTSAIVPGLNNGTPYTFTVTATNANGTSSQSAQSNTVTPMPGGYWLVASDGGIFPFGDAGGYGSTGNIRLNQPIVGMAATASGHGYWLVASDGGIFPFGDAPGYGSTGNLQLKAPIVGMARTPSGHGYWLVASDGGIFPFGDAGGYGSTGNLRLNQPMVDMAPTVSGHGYWLVAKDGGIFPFGDAVGYGGTGNIRLNQPMVGMAPTASGHGYWLVASDGGIFPFGDAPGYGGTGGIALNQPIVGMSATTDGLGYWLVASDGGIFPFGDAPGAGSTGGMRLNRPIVGMASTA
jgi:hypothetical protein